MRQKKQSGGAARDQSMTSPDTIMAERETKHSVSPENVKEKNALPSQFPVDHDPRKPAEWRKGMRTGFTMADMINTPEYKEHAAKVSTAAELAETKEETVKKENRRAYQHRRYWKRTHGDAVKALLIEAFKVPVMLALPAPGQITREPQDPWRIPPHDFDRKINSVNPRFKGFRPQWILDAEKTVRVSGTDFEMLRKTCLYMTREQCAAYLRVLPGQVARWEEGTEQIPYAAYQCLRLTFETQIFKRWRPQWEGWRIIEHGEDVGKLLDPRSGNCYTAYEVSMIARQWGELFRLRNKCDRLRDELEQAQAENIRLRKLFLSDGVTDELRSMKDRLSALMTSIATAEVVDFPQSETAAKPRRKKA